MNELQAKLARRKLLNGEGSAAAASSSSATAAEGPLNTSVANSTASLVEAAGDVAPATSCVNSNSAVDNNSATSVVDSTANRTSTTTDELSLKLARRRSWEEGRKNAAVNEATGKSKAQFGQQDLPFNAAAVHAQNEDADADADDDEPDFVDIQHEQKHNGRADASSSNSSGQQQPQWETKEETAASTTLSSVLSTATAAAAASEVPHWLTEAEDDINWKAPAAKATTAAATVVATSEEGGALAVTVPFVTVPSVDSSVTTQLTSPETPLPAVETVDTSLATAVAATAVDTTATAESDAATDAAAVVHDEDLLLSVVAVDSINTNTAAAPTATSTAAAAAVEPPVSISDLPVWEPAADVAVRLDRWFELLDKESTGKVGGKDIVKFLLRSKLQWDSLRAIWAMVDRQNTGFVDAAGFRIIMRLVSIACSDRHRNNSSETLSLQLYVSTIEEDIPLPLSIDRRASSNSNSSRDRTAAATTTTTAVGEDVSPATRSKLAMSSDTAKSYFQEFLTDVDDALLAAIPLSAAKSDSAVRMEDLNSLLRIPSPASIYNTTAAATANAQTAATATGATTELEQLRIENNLLKQKLQELTAALHNKQSMIDAYELTYPTKSATTAAAAVNTDTTTDPAAIGDKTITTTTLKNSAAATTSSRARNVRRVGALHYYSAGFGASLPNGDEGEEEEGALFDDADAAEDTLLLASSRSSRHNSKDQQSRGSALNDPTAGAFNFLSGGDEFDPDAGFDALLDSLGDLKFSTATVNNSSSSGSSGSSGSSDSNNPFGLLDGLTAQSGGTALALSSVNFIARSFAGAQKNGFEAEDDEEMLSQHRQAHMTAILDSHGLFGGGNSSSSGSGNSSSNGGSSSAADGIARGANADTPSAVATAAADGEQSAAGKSGDDEATATTISGNDQQQQQQLKANLFGDDQKRSSASSNSESSKKAMDYQEFLYRFTRCLDLVDLTRKFLFSVLGPNGDASAPAKGKKLNYVFYGLYKLDQRCKGFFDQMQQMIEEHQEFRGEDEERLLCARDGLEQYIMCRIADFAYDMCMTPQEDRALSRRMRVLSFLTPESMYIKKELFNETLLSLAGDELRRINAFKTPGDKVACVVKSAAIIFRSLSLCSKSSGEDGELGQSKGDNTPAGADDFLPLFIWVVMRSHIPNLCSNCEYIETYLNPARLIGKSGYCLINLRSAIEFVLYSDASQINMDADEFNANVAAAEVAEP